VLGDLLKMKQWLSKLKTELKFYYRQALWRFEALLATQGCLLCASPIVKAAPTENPCPFCTQQWQWYKQPKPLAHNSYAGLPWQKRFRSVFYTAKFKQKAWALRQLTRLLVFALQRQLAFLGEQGVPTQKIVLTWIPSRDGAKNAFYAVASHAGWLLGLSVKPNLLRWQRVTLPQHKLAGKRERRLNMSQAFKAVLDDELQKQSPSCILVVDDLWTSGNTLKQAQKAIKEALPKGGTSQVIAMALAYMPLGQRQHAFTLIDPKAAQTEETLPFSAALR
jgi:predicted amidophosphoribosyltransferase